MTGVRGLTPRKPPSFPRRRESRGAVWEAGLPPPKYERNKGKCPKDKGGPLPLRMWGLCGRSIAGIRLYARNTGKPWSATAIAQPHHTPETYQTTYIDRSTRVADLLNLDTALEPGDIDTLTGYAGTKYGVPTEAAIRSHPPRRQNRSHHPRPKLHRQIDVRPNRPNPHPKPRPKNPHNLHPPRRPTPNLRLPRPTLKLETHLNTNRTLRKPSPLSQNEADTKVGRVSNPPPLDKSSTSISYANIRFTISPGIHNTSQRRCNQIVQTERANDSHNTRLDGFPTRPFQRHRFKDPRTFQSEFLDIFDRSWL